MRRNSCANYRSGVTYDCQFSIVLADKTINNAIEVIKGKYEILNLKESRKSGWDEPKRLAITQEIFDALKESGATVRASILGEIALKDVHEVSDNYFGAFVFLLERFFITLQMEDDTGMIIFDSVNGSLEGKLRRELYAFISKERHWMRGAKKDFYNKRIIPAVLFSDDSYNNILQASDSIANCLTSAAWHYRQEEKTFDTERLIEKNPFLKVYWPLVVKSPDGKADGWGVKIWQ